jgi:hypothetical protein
MLSIDIFKTIDIYEIYSVFIHTRLVDYYLMFFWLQMIEINSDQNRFQILGWGFSSVIEYVLSMQKALGE